MNIKNISYFSDTPSFWERVIFILLVPFGILAVILGILFFPMIWIYDFVNTKIFGIKEKECATLYIESILFENEIFKIIIHNMMLEEECEVFYEFFDNISNEEYQIYQLIDKKQPSGLGNIYITSFYFLVDKKLLLQKVCQENDEIKTYLISFHLDTAEVEIIKEIGNYLLEYYNEKTYTIIGFGKDDNIKIELE